MNDIMHAHLLVCNITNVKGERNQQKTKNVNRNDKTAVQKRLLSTFVHFIINRQQFRISLEWQHSFLLQSGNQKCKVNINFYVKLLFVAL